MKQLISILTITIIIFSSSLYSEDYFGEYNGTVQTEWLDDGRTMKLLSDFSYKDPNGLVWSAKKGQTVDGASIPPLLWSVIGSPLSGKYRNASVIHDIACVEEMRTWEVVHLAFFYAMRASGVSKYKSKAMYAAVYHFGPRWSMKKLIITQEESTKTVIIPARYNIVSERILVKPSSEFWDENSKTMKVVPAQYKTVRRKVISTQAGTKEIIIPAKYRSVEVPPSLKHLDKSGFEKLVSKLEKLDKEGKSISLQQIREFK